MHRISLIRFVVGVIGNIISIFMFLSPMPTFIRIYKNKSTEDFHPYPYLAAFMNCILWTFYGMSFVHPDSALVVTINSFGLFMEIEYLIIFFIYTSKSKYKLHIFLILVGELLLFGGIVALSLLGFHTTTRRSMVVGVICDVFGVIMYASPLSATSLVIKNKNAEYMPFWLCVAGFLNGGVWFCYAFLKKFEPYIAIVNGIGGAFGAIQLLLHAYYYFKGKSNNVAKDEVVKAEKIK